MANNVRGSCASTMTRRMAELSLFHDFLAQPEQLKQFVIANAHSTVRKRRFEKRLRI